MGGIEPDDDLQKNAPPLMKPSAWPLLSPLTKFINDITTYDIQTQLFPIGIEKKNGVLPTLLSFMTAHDFCKLMRLSAQFYSKSSSITLFANSSLVFKYLFQIGNYDCHLTNKSRLRACIWEKTLLQGDERIHEFISKWTYEDIIQKIEGVKISQNTNRPLPIKGMTEIENDLVCQVYIDLYRTKDPLNPDTTVTISEDDMLANLRILYAVCAKVFPETGYCQGINYISVIFH